MSYLLLCSEPTLSNDYLYSIHVVCIICCNSEFGVVLLWYLHSYANCLISLNNFANQSHSVRGWIMNRRIQLLFVKLISFAKRIQWFTWCCFLILYKVLERSDPTDTLIFLSFFMWSCHVKQKNLPPCPSRSHPQSPRRSGWDHPI